VQILILSTFGSSYPTGFRPAPR